MKEKDKVKNEDVKQVISGNLRVGSLFYSAPQSVPNKDGRIVVIRMKCFGPLEVYEWGIDADQSFYEMYQWCENDLYDDNYDKKISKEKFIEQIENMKRLIQGTEAADWAETYDKILRMIEDGKLTFENGDKAPVFSGYSWYIRRKV